MPDFINHKQHSAADFIRLMEKDLSAGLIQPHYFSRILSLSQNLPPISLLGLECRLSDKNDLVDFALCIYGKKGFNRLARFISNHGLTSSKADLISQNWKKIYDFAVHIQEKDDFLQQLVSAMWLNIDVTEKEEDFPVPWIYVIYKDSFIGHEVMSTVLLESMKILRTTYSNDILGHLNSCIDHLPPQAHILGLGIQSIRNVDAVRLVIYNLSARQITSFLGEISANFDTQSLLQNMISFEGLSESLGFIFDVDNHGIKDEIGIEFYISKSTQWKDVPRFIDLLSGHELCDQGKGQAVNLWPLDSSNSRLTTTWINHFKLKYNSKAAISSKVYLGCEYSGNFP